MFCAIYISFAFLVANMVILLVILALNRRVHASPGQTGMPAHGSSEQKVLDSSDILGWEFEYARITASEAMHDRHTMINFYLLIVAVVGSGVAAVLGQKAESASLPRGAGTTLLWVLCGVGWLYFLNIIRLRQAWHDSAQAMGRIKAFYIQYAKEFSGDVLSSAFRWHPQTLPAPDKPWTVFFHSALLIAFLDSVAYVMGGSLINATLSFLSVAGALLILFGLAFFAFHIWLYFTFLRP
jgi:hypothetical protein